MSRRVVTRSLVVLAAITLAGCGADGAGQPPAPGRSALDAAIAGEADSLGDSLVPLDQLRSGGPPPDGIPSVDDPRFVAASDPAADFLAANEPVLALEVNGVARAYPVQVLIWHEIVNDEVGGVPVAVTYCPLCNSAVAYDRRVQGRVLEFGVSGLLWNSSMIMFDRQTESLWSHFTGRAVAGTHLGASLERVAVSTVSFGQWRDTHPDGEVMTRETGFERPYGRNPYPGYDAVDQDPFLFDGPVDGRYPPMTRVVGIERDGETVTVPLDLLRAARRQRVSVGAADVEVWWGPGTASALDASTLELGADIGTTGVFVPVWEDTPLTFRPGADGEFTDAETASIWNVLGRAVAGPLTGAQLVPLIHVDTFWFAWVVFHPDTTVAGA